MGIGDHLKNINWQVSRWHPPIKMDFQQAKKTVRINKVK